MSVFIYQIDDTVCAGSINADDIANIDDIVKSILPTGITYYIKDSDTLPNEPIEAWYIENGEVKIDQEKLKLFNRSRLPSLSRRQFKRTLHDFKLKERVELMIDSITDQDVKTKIEIDYYDGDRFERMSELIKYVAALLKLSDEQVDQMWLHAMSL